MLAAAGELGYHAASVADVVERVEPGGNVGGFDRYFTGVEDCFAIAYEAGSEYLCARLLGAGAAEESWADGLRAALVTLFELVTREPAAARALLIEGHAAGGRALVKRKEVIERLSRAIESARRETVSRHSSSPLTGMFIIGAIEFAVSRFSLDPEPQPEKLWRLLPELMHFAVLPYLGEEAAWAAFDEAMAMVDGQSEGRISE